MKLLISLFLCFSIVADCLGNIYQGPLTQVQFEQLSNTLSERRQVLEDKMKLAIDQQIPVDYARVSLQTIKLFENVLIPRNISEQAQIQSMYDAKGFSRNDRLLLNNNLPRSEQAKALPFDQVSDAIVVANNAINQLEQQLSGAIELATPPCINKIELDNNQFFPNKQNPTLSLTYPSCFTQDNLILDDNATHYRIANNYFIANKFFWHPEDSEMVEAYGSGGEMYADVRNLATPFSLQSGRQSGFIDRANRQSALGLSPVQYFLGHIVPQNSPLRELNPEAFLAPQGGVDTNPNANFYRLFTEYDIDNPEVRVWVKTLIEGSYPDTLTVLNGTERVHMLANEPTFSIREGGVNANRGVSDYTYQAYQDWLINKYTTIAQLNRVYGRNFTSFNDVKNTYQIPLPLSLQGSAAWYDWNIFNMERVNNWFSFLHNTVKQVDPSGKTHIKIMGERAIHTQYMDEGLDLEFIAKLVDMPGSDNQLTPGSADWDVRHYQEWRDRYSLEWRAQSMMLDFNLSMAPNKAFYDSEWHGLSGARWRDFHVFNNYVNAALWLGVSDGLANLTTWVWNRRLDGEIRNSGYFPGATDNQPIQIDSYGRAMKQINAHANDIKALLPQSREVFLFYNKVSAIQDPTYADNLSDVYEALKLTNVKVGFATPTSLESLNPDEDILVLSPNHFIKDDDVVALLRFSEQGGKVINIAEANQQYKNEYGAVRTQPIADPYLEINFTATGQKDVIFDLAKQLKSELHAILPEQIIEVSQSSGSTETAGVLVKKVENIEAKTFLMSLINTRNIPIDVVLGEDGQLTNIVNQVTNRIHLSEFTLAPLEVLLLKGEVVELSVEPPPTTTTPTTTTPPTTTPTTPSSPATSTSSSGGSVSWLTVIFLVFFTTYSVANPLSFNKVTDFLSQEPNLRKWDAPVIADLDHDGYPDLLLNDHGFSVKVIWNDQGIFADPYDIIVGDMHGVSVGDFNRDGLLDIVIAKGGGSGANARNAIIFSVDRQRQFNKLPDFVDPLAYMRGRTVKWVDLNQDGYLDLINFAFPDKSKKGKSENYLYKNDQNANLSLANVLPPSYQDGQKVLLVDLNNDQNQDILMYGHNQVRGFINNGDFKFTAVSDELGLSGIKNVTSAVSLDIDNDGDQDLLLTRGEYFSSGDLFYNPSSQMVGAFHKRGKFQFPMMVSDGPLNMTNIQSQWPHKHVFKGKHSELHTYPGETHSGRTLSLSSQDALGFPDVISDKGMYVGHQLDAGWLIQGDINPPFTAIIKNITDVKGMTIDPDSHAQPKNDFHNVLLINDNGTWVDNTAEYFGIQDNNTYASAVGDVNNDGFTDVVLIDRGNLVTPPKVLIYHNIQGKKLLKADTDNNLKGELGSIGLGVDLVDYDQDGLLDILVGDDRGKWSLYKNTQQTPLHYLKVQVKHSPLTHANPNFATVRLTGCGVIQTRIINANGAMYSTNGHNTAHFGIQNCLKSHNVRVTWSDLSTVSRDKVSPDQKVSVGIEIANIKR